MTNNQLKLTTKQQQTLQLLYRFRFLNRSQLQRFFAHSDYMRLNTWLHFLTDKQYTGRLYTPQIKDGTKKPAVYYLDTQGIQFLKTQSGLDPQLLHKLYRESKRSSSFRDRCLLLAEIYLSVREYVTDTVQYGMFVPSAYPGLSLAKELST